jgi:hypothetical protein
MGLSHGAGQHATKKVQSARQTLAYMLEWSLVPRLRGLCKRLIHLELTGFEVQKFGL